MQVNTSQYGAGVDSGLHGRLTPGDCKAPYIPGSAHCSGEQEKPPGQRCRPNCSPHCASSPNWERNSSTVSILPRDLLSAFFMQTIISPFIRLNKMDIHQFEKTPILQALQPSDYDTDLSDLDNQLILFDF